MEQFIGCDAHKTFSVFVAVNEKGQAGEALPPGSACHCTGFSARKSGGRPRLKPDLGVSLRRFGMVGRHYGLLVAINDLGPFAFCRNARCTHQLGNGFDRRRIGTRETRDVTLGDE